MKQIIIGFLLFVTISANAQRKGSAVHIGWNIMVPFSDKDFTGNTSTGGVRAGFSKFINDRFGFGIEGGYSTLDGYVPRTTYEYPGGAITTDIYNYLYYYTIMANGQYYFRQGERFIPYASLGAGVAFSEYRIFYNVYQEADNETSFVVRPEVGTLFRVKAYSGWGFKGAVSVDFAANKNDSFNTDNLAGLSLQLGAVFFID